MSTTNSISAEPFGVTMRVGLLLSLSPPIVLPAGLRKLKCCFPSPLDQLGQGDDDDDAVNK